MLDYLTSQRELRWTRWLLVVFVPLALLYFVASKGNGETKNHEVTEKDQKVYLNTASRIAHDPFGYFTPRQRTPGYPYFLSLFYSKEKFDRPDGSKPPFDLAWFERGKTINILLSMAMLGGLFVFCRSLLPVVESGIVTIAAGLLLFVYKAGYVQPELSYWVLNTILFVLMGKMLLVPGWRLAAACGVLSVVTYFVKAGTQPLLLLFVVTWILKLAWDAFSFRKRKARGALDAGEARPATWKHAGQGALVLAIFLLVLSPYLMGTKKQFGKPFYSVYSEYMMWLPMEDHENHFVDKDYMWAFYEAGARERLITIEEFNTELERRVRKRVMKGAKGEGLSQEEIDEAVAAQYKPLAALPSPGGYFEEYSLGEGVDRVEAGLARTAKRMKKYYRRAMSMLGLVGRVALIGLLVRIVMLLWERFSRGGRRLPVVDVGGGDSALRVLARSPYLVFYAVGFFTGYLVLYAWYDALRIDARLMLSLYLPMLFTGVFVGHHLLRNLAIPGVIGGRPLMLGKVANLFLAIMLTYLCIRLLGNGELYDPSMTEP